MLDLILIPVASFLDRLRGDAGGLPSKTIELLLYGWVISAICGYSLHPLWTPAIVVLFSVGGAIGWGTPMTAFLYYRKMPLNDLEWWQKGPLQDNVEAAIIARGVLWGLPVLVLLPWVPEVASVAIAYTVAFPLSLWLARKLESFAVEFGSNSWHLAEYLRGGIGAATVALLTSV